MHNKVANEVSKLAATNLPPAIQQKHSFVITATDNFNINIRILRGENSIRILNLIMMQTPVNNELKFDVKKYLNDLCLSVASAVDKSDCNVLFKSNAANLRAFTTPSTVNKNEPYMSYKNNSYIISYKHIF